MQFAINYSPQAAELLKAGKIQIDNFKCPDWPHLIAEAAPLAPVAVHFDLSAGSGRLDELTDWKTIEALCQQTNTPHVNVHIDPKVKDYPGLVVDAPTPAEEEQITDALAADFQNLARRFGAQNVIAENAPYEGQRGHVIRTAADPEVIRQVIEASGIGLLLDISHASISAGHLGMAEQEYFARLPLRQTRELHFAGIQVIEGRRVDHLAVQPADWERLDWALDQIRAGGWGQPWMLAFEYGGIGPHFDWRSKAEVIEAQVPQLYARVSRMGL